VTDRPSRKLSRRTVLGALGVGVVGAVAGTSWYELSKDSNPRITLSQWTSSRGQHYYVAHRGSGDVRPEHTVQAYEAAQDWGAKAMEISTSSTSDGVLICMHDLTYDRTTNATGTIRDLPSSFLNNVGVLQPQLGPAWTNAPLPKVPLFEDVLKRFGGHLILCVEPKRDDDYTRMIALVDKYQLHDSVIVKLFHTSTNFDAAKAAGYPLFAYLSSADVSVDSIAKLARRLNNSTDYLVIPSSTSDNQEYLPEKLVAAAVETGVPVWVYPIHRRSEADRYFSLGVAGAISGSVGYSRGAVRRLTADSWRSGAIAPGELTRQPANFRYAPKWGPEGEFTFAAQGVQHFITLGQFAPVANADQSYNIEFEARWDVLPADLGTNISIAFGHSDDRYYEHQLGNSNGYHAILRANGSLELYKHVVGVRTGTQLGDAVITSTPQPGQWMKFRIEVQPTSIKWTRMDLDPQPVVTAEDSQFRGGYLHLGRTSNDASLTLRNLLVGK
jgi:glycerophosphoryl diester phosphodiesterase